MNRKKQLLMTFLTALMLSVFFSMTAFAATRIITAKAGKMMTDKNSERGDVTYFKVKAPKNGYLTVTTYAQYRKSDRSKYGQYVQLCNSKKKVIANTRFYASSSDKYVTYYGVKKGTYYLRVDNDYYDSDVKLKYSFKAVSQKGGATKAKAVSISRNKTRTGLMLAGQKGNRQAFYKIKLTKKRTLQLSVTSKVDGMFNVEIIPAKSSVSGGYLFLSDKDSKTWKSEEKLPVGTYYVRVYTSDKYPACGSYTLKWK